MTRYDHQHDHSALIVSQDTETARALGRVLRGHGITVLQSIGEDRVALRRSLNQFPGAIFFAGSRDENSTVATEIREAAIREPTLVVFLHPDIVQVGEIRTGSPSAVLSSLTDEDAIVAYARSGFRFRESMNITGRLTEPTSVTICAWCQHLQTDDGWVSPGEYFMTSPPRSLSHGICEQCAVQLLTDRDEAALQELIAGCGVRAQG